VSRETDNPSPTPPRPSGGAYPSGTPPYGVPSDPAFSRAGQPQEQAAEEPRTEQTLTTRIRINIPGSRPIPPVVVRSPVGGAQPPEDEPQDPTAEVPAPPLPKRRHRADASGSPVLGVMEGAGPATPPDLPPEWQIQGGAAGTPAAPAAAEAEAAEGPPEPGTGTWFAPRKKGRPAAQPQQTQPLEPPQPPPVEPQAQAQPFAEPAPQAFEPPPFEPPPFDAQFDPRYEPPQAPQPEPQFDPQFDPRYDQPFDQRFEAQFAPQADYQQAEYQQAEYQQADYQQPDYQQPPGYQPPAYEQPGYEQTEQTPLPPPQAQAQPPAPPQAFPSFPGFTGGLTVAGGTGAPAREPEATDAFEATAPLPLFREEPPPAPAPPVAPAQPAPGGKKNAPKNSQPGGAKAAKKGGAAQPDAGVSPVPTPAPVPAGYAGGTGGAGAPPRKPGTEPEAAAGTVAAKAGTAKRSSPGGRARKLLTTGIGLLVLVGAVAYGAGLMLNQADVPKGTTVLGYSIGGDVRDNAVNTLNSTVGKLATQPLELSVGGRTVALNPVMAGLTIDTTQTVQLATHHSYNPVTVVESLFGGTHPISPVVVVDPDKLRYALQQLSVGSGSAREGSVHFREDGTVVTVLPQAGQSLDVDAAVTAVQQAYRARADGVADKPVVLALTTAQPKASAAVVQAAAASIGKWAMAQHFTVKAGGVVEDFGPITFSQALTLQPNASGALVPVFDLGKLAAAYGPTFSGVQIKHNGVLGPVTPQDIAGALTQLLSKPGGPTSLSL